jgi:antitoxin component YwqK of YwqJK toxin-antitoxin module
MLHGNYKIYSYEGVLILDAQLNGGVMEQYTYLGKDGKPVTPIVLPSNETADIKTYFPNGNLALSYSLKNGLIHGKYERFYENGKPHESTNYVNGNFEGDYKLYAPSGTILTAETYYYDERQGTGFYYNETGKLIKEINYLLGVKHGVSKTYDPATGKVLSTTNYMYNK